MLLSSRLADLIHLVLLHVPSAHLMKREVPKNDFAKGAARTAPEELVRHAPERSLTGCSSQTGDDQHQSELMFRNAPNSLFICISKRCAIRAHAAEAAGRLSQ